MPDVLHLQFWEDRQDLGVIAEVVGETLPFVDGVTLVVGFECCDIVMTEVSGGEDNRDDPVVNRSRECSDFGNIECSVFGNNTTVDSATMMQ